MKSANFRLLLIAVLVVALSGISTASDINVLWYTGGANNFNPEGYNGDVLNLAAAAPGAPGANTWNVTFWSGGARPTGDFNVLVVASPIGGWSANPTYGALSASFPTLGDRLMLTGQDADWHYMNSPGPANFNGPKGFLLDGINWAGSGTGMGAVFLGYTAGFYNIGVGGFSQSCSGGNNVVIPGS